MRTCQICDSKDRVIVQEAYGKPELTLYACDECGHRYVDGDVNQAWFDNYYLTEYQTDDKPYSAARLDSLAAFVQSFEPKTILDIGGMDGELQKRLDCDVAGVGSEIKKKYNAVILSHTLEHIYDIHTMFERIKASLKKNGLLVIEIPIHIYDNYLAPSAYDWHWQHINKFRPRDIARLCTQKGYKIMVSEQIADYREYQVWRIAGRA